MDRDRETDKMESILHLTLEILFWLTREDYTVVKKTSSERCQDPVSEGWGRPLSQIAGPRPHTLIHEDINDQKILELTYKMIELLTGEVPIRCQDVTIYFSMEEWAYLEEHKDLYKDVMMEVPQQLTSPGLSSKRTTPERCPCPLLPQDCKQEDPDVPQDHQGEDVPRINTTETYVSGDEWCKVEIATDNYPDDCPGISEEHWLSIDCKADDCGITENTNEEHAIISNIAHHSKDLSSKASQKVVVNQRGDTEEKPFSCSEYEKCFDWKSKLTTHKNIHTGEKPFFCNECGKCFAKKSYLLRHQKIHTGEKPYSCSECGKCFNQLPSLIQHKKIHTGVKPYTCEECEALFSSKSSLVKHQNIHTGEKPYTCSECGKCFNAKASLLRHQWVHTGVKPFSCSECGKCFTEKSSLVKHQNIHTGAKPYSCSECGKCFNRKPSLVKHKLNHAGVKPFSCEKCGKCFNDKYAHFIHQKFHTGEIPFSCSECGKHFNSKASLVQHQWTHTGLKPFSCSECGKCFNQKRSLITHQKIHTGE